MAESMRDEFQQLVQTMVEEISEKIFMTQLEEICHQFSEQLGDYKEAIRDGKQASDEVVAYAKNNKNSVQQLEGMVQGELGEIRNMIQQVSGEYRKIFDGFSREVTNLNDAQRNAFLDALRDAVGREGQELTSKLKHMLDDNIKLGQELSQKLEEQQGALAVTEQNMNDGFSDIKSVIHRMDNQYQEIFKGFSQKVSALNETERKKFLKELDQVFDKIKASIPKMVDRSCHEVLDVFSKDLQNVSKENSEKLSEFRKYIDEMNRRSAEFTNASKKNAERIQELTQELDSRLIEVKDAIKTIDQEYETVFEGFSQNVAALNEAERARFKAEIENILVDYRGTFGEELGKKYEHISEKFRKDLEEIYVEYDRQLNENTSYLSDTKNCMVDVKDCMKENVGVMNSLNDRLTHSVSALNRSVDSIKEEVDGILQGYSAEVAKINEEERTAFSREIADTIHQKENAVLMMLDEKIEGFRSDYETIQNELKGEYQKHEIAIEAQLTDLKAACELMERYAMSLAKLIAAMGKKMEEHRGCISKATSYMQEGYREQFVQYIDEIGRRARQERDDAVNSISEISASQKTAIEVLLEQQEREMGNLVKQQKQEMENLVKQQRQSMQELTGQQRREMEEFARQQNQEMQNYYKKQESLATALFTRQLQENKDLLAELERKIAEDARREEAASWRFFMTASNLFLMVLMAVMMFVTGAWFQLGVNGSMACILFSVLIVLSIVFRKQMIRLIRGRKKDDDNGQEQL